MSHAPPTLRRTTRSGGAALGVATLVLATLLSAVPPAQAADQAQEKFTFAVRLMQRGERELAAEAFRSFLRRFPDNDRTAQAHYYLAVLALRRGETKAARKQLEQIGEPDRLDPHALALLRGQVALDGGDPAAAVEALEKVDPKALSGEASRAKWHFLIGRAYRSSGNLGAAAKHLDRAAEKGSPVRATAALALGRTRKALGRPEAAIEAWRTAADADGGVAAEALGLAAETAQKAGKAGLAAELYGRIVSNHQGSDAFKKAILGELRARFADGQFSRVVERYAAVKDLLAPGDRAEALYLVGASQVRAGSYEKAIGVLRKFVRAHGLDHERGNEVAYLLAIAYYRTDPKAFEQWMKRIEGRIAELPNKGAIRYLRAMAALRQGQRQRAADYLGALIDGGRYARQALRSRASIYEKLGKRKKALADYRTFLSRYPDAPTAPTMRRRAVELAFGLGRMEKVVTLGKQADEKSPRVRLRMGLAHMKLGQQEKAKKHLSRVIDGKASEELTALAHLYRGLIRGAAADGSKEPLDAAIADLEAAREGPLPDAERSKATAALARLQRKRGRPEEAYEALEARRKQEPLKAFNAEELLWAGKQARKRGKPAAAVTWLVPLTQRKNIPAAMRAEALFHAAKAYQETEKWKKAVETYRRLVGLSEGYGNRGRLGLAQSLAAAGEVEKAITQYDGLIRVESSRIAATALLESARLYRKQARRYERAGEADRAKKYRKEAVRRLHRISILHDVPELKRLVQRSLIELAVLARAQDQTERAKKAVKQLIKGYPNSAWADVARAELALLNGRRGEAKFLWKKLLKKTSADRVAEHVRQRLAEIGGSR